MNGFIKDGAREAVDDPERRRIRGVAAQSVLVAFQLLAANIRKIDQFLTSSSHRGQKGPQAPVTTPDQVATAVGSGANHGRHPDPVDASGDPDPPSVCLTSWRAPAAVGGFVASRARDTTAGDVEMRPESAWIRPQNLPLVVASPATLGPETADSLSFVGVT